MTGLVVVEQCVSRSVSRNVSQTVSRNVDHMATLRNSARIISPSSLAD